MNKTILIADDDADVVDLLSYRCRAMGLNIVTANSAVSALLAAEDSQPDVVILDVDMPQGNGLTVCEMMAEHEQLNNIPVVMLTASSREETIQRCHQLRAFYVLKAPDVWPRVEPILRELIADEKPADTASENAPTAMMDAVFTVLGVEEGNCLADDETVTPRSDEPWVLSIEDDDDVFLALQMRLQAFGVQVIRAAEGTEGYRQAFLQAPRAIILDYELPQGNGDYVLRRLKETPATRDIPVIVLTGRREASIQRQMLSLGASEFLTKPLDWTRLRAALDLHLDAAKMKPSSTELHEILA